MKKILCVMATCSNEYIVQDQIESIFWGIQHPLRIVVVNDGNYNVSITDNRVNVIKPKGNIHQAGKVGFKVNEGIHWAIQNNIEFDCVMVLDDDALILRRGLENFVFEKFQDKKIGMIAVKDDKKANKAYSTEDKKETYKKFILNWTGNKNFEIPNEFAFYAVNFQSYDLVKCLYENKLLESNKEEWPYPCETFQTIFTKLLGFEIHYHGQYPDDLKPPLYVMHHGSVKPPDPRKISKEFLIHHSIRNVNNVKEHDIRNYYKKLRTIRYL